MQAWFRGVVAGVVAVGCLAGEPGAPAVKIEFRAAADRAAPGLTEMAVQGSTRNEKVYVQDQALLTNAAIRSAAATPADGGSWRIAITFTDAGAATFGELTASCVGKRLAIIVDGQVLSAPVVRDRIAGGRAEISGAFTEAEAKRIADGLTKAR